MTPTCCLRTLDGGRTNDECLLEGLGLGAELRGSALQRYSLLGYAGNVDGGLLVEAGLVVKQRHIAAEGQGRASRRGHLQQTCHMAENVPINSKGNPEASKQ